VGVDEVATNHDIIGSFLVAFVAIVAHSAGVDTIFAKVMGPARVHDDAIVELNAPRVFLVVLVALAAIAGDVTVGTMVLAAWLITIPITSPRSRISRDFGGVSAPCVDLRCLSMALGVMMKPRSVSS
jgi:hypothetical protein